MLKLMDDIVRKSIAKWPNVPSVYGWLSLDRRGQWRLKGEAITNPGLIAFIERNYEHDQQGRWYFQNGPQRVYVRLDYLPFVLRVDENSPDLRLVTHTGLEVAEPKSAWIDEGGNLIIGFAQSAGLICDQDLDSLLPYLSAADGGLLGDPEIERAMLGEAAGLTLRVAQALLPVTPLRSQTLGQRFGFISDPRPAPGEPEC